MDAFITHTGVGVPLRRSNVDTDQIIPAEYLKRVARTGFEDGLFAAWRSDPSFVLAGPDFGTGSSREHAVWALMDYGFRVVISSRFADIFRGNSGKGGLLTAVCAQDDVELLWKVLENEPGAQVSVDLVARTVSAGDIVAPFHVDDYTRWRLLEGLDDIGLTLRHEPEIAAFETTRARYRPTTVAVAGINDYPPRCRRPGPDGLRSVGPDAGTRGEQVNKADLISIVEPRVGSRKVATDVVESIFDAVIREVAGGGKVAITGFGTFEAAARAPRTGRNPRTGEPVPIRKTVAPRFKPGTTFRSVVAAPDLLDDTTGTELGVVSLVRRASAVSARIGIDAQLPLHRRAVAATSPSPHPVVVKKASKKKSKKK